MTPSGVVVRGLRKRFGRQQVLAGLDLVIQPGRITAIVGPNAAGKTTLIKTILGLVRPDRDGGTVAVDGILVNGGPEYRERIGYMPQAARFPEQLTGHEIIRLLTDLRGRTADLDQELVERFGLAASLDKPIRNLSGGTRQKLNAVVACLFRPSLLILDEPTAGLDPVAASILKDKVLRAPERGTTVLLTSHIMSEVEELAQDLVFLMEGGIAFQGTVEELLSQTGESRLERAIARRLADAVHGAGMRTAGKVLASQLRNVARSRWILGYTILLLLTTELLLRFGGSGERALLSLLNVVLLLLPLMSVTFGALYVYNAREFLEMLLAQPVGRGSLYAGLFGGLALPLSGAFLAGVGLPLLIQGGGEPGFAGHAATMLAVGVLLTLAYTAFALCVSVLIEDRARGLGAALLVWLLTTLVYDGLILLVATRWSDYPLEAPLLVLVFLNPVDLARVLLLLSFDISAMMGYTGAVYERFFRGGLGIVLGFGMLLVCAGVPLLFGLRWFRRKDF